MVRRLTASLIRLPLRLIPKTAVLPVLSGPLRGARWVAGAATHGCWLGTYERLSQAVFAEHVRSGGVVYDVGANAGFFTLLASRIVGPSGRVYAFEPLERNLELLRTHLGMNEVSNVRIMPTAVADRTGTTRFATGANPAMVGIAETGDIQVATTTLDLVRSTEPPPTFLKMDIEGAESKALAGAQRVLRVDRPVILLSAHGIEQYEHCTKVLRETSYAVKLLVDGSRDGNYVVLAVPVEVTSVSA